MKFTVVLAPEEPSGYSVTCPAVPGAVSQGDTLAETLANIEEAIQGCWEADCEAGFPLVQETPEVIAREIEEVLKTRVELGRPLTIQTTEVEVEVEVAV